MRRLIVLLVLMAGPASADDTADDIIHMLRRGNVAKAADALKDFEATAAEAAKIAAVAVDAPLRDPRSGIVLLGPVSRRIKDELSKTAPMAIAASLGQQVDRTHDRDGGLSRPHLDSLFVMSRAIRVSDRPVPAARAADLARLYAKLDAPDSTNLARAIKVVRWARTLPDADVAALLKQEAAWADQGLKLSPGPHAPLFKLAGFSARLAALEEGPPSAARKGFVALIGEVRPLAAVEGADLAVVRFHRRLVTRARRARVRADYVADRHELLDRLVLSVPRGIEWRLHRTRRSTRLLRYGLRGHERYSFTFTSFVTERKGAVRETIKNRYEKAKDSPSGGKRKPPHSVRLGPGVRGARMFQVGDVGAGHPVVRRTYVWSERWRRKKTRVVVAVLEARSEEIDDPELDFVLSTIRSPK